MAYPSSFDALTNPGAGSSVVTLSHATQHTNVNNAVEAIEAVVGTTAGTNVLKDFSAGQFPARVNAGGTIVQTLTGGTITTSTIRNTTIGSSAFNTGTLNAPSIGTPTITAGTVLIEGTVVPLSFGAAIAPTVVTLTDPNDGGTVTPNAQAGQVFSMVIGTAGTRTIANPANATTDGQVLIFRIKQNAGVTGTIGWGAGYKWNLGSAGTLGTVASVWNYYGFRVNMTGTTYDNTGALVDVG